MRYWLLGLVSGLFIGSGSAIAQEQLNLTDFFKFPYDAPEGEYKALGNFTAEVSAIEGTDKFELRISNLDQTDWSDIGTWVSTSICREGTIVFTAPRSIAKTVAREYSSSLVYRSNLYFELSSLGDCEGSFVADIKKIEVLSIGGEVIRTLR